MPLFRGSLIKMSKHQNMFANSTLVMQNIALTYLAEICIHSIGLKRTWAILQAIRISKQPVVPEEKMVKQCLSATKQASSAGPRFTKCLARSLVLWWQLDRRHVSVKLVIGVRTAKNFRAHAWVEYNDKPLNAGENARDRYKVIGQFEGLSDLT